MAESLEDAEADDDNAAKQERPPVDTSWASLESVRNIINRTSAAAEPKGEDGKRSKHIAQVDAAVQMSKRIWMPPQSDAGGQWSKECSIGRPNIESTERKPVKKNTTAGAEVGASARLLYGGLTPAKANRWLHDLVSKDAGPENLEKPSVEQLNFLKAVVARCITEARECDADTLYPF